MDTEHDQFEQVRKLLALKRHEQPPPRFFQDFSGKVIARLQALEAVRAVTWRQRLGLDFDLKPALLGVFGVGACALLLVGVITSLVMNQPTPSFGFATGTESPFAASSEPALASGLGVNPVASAEEIPDSTAPLGSSSSTLGGSPFDVFAAPHVERAKFTLGPGN